MDIEKLKIDAENGDAEAQCALGKMLLGIDCDGANIAENTDEGVELLKSAAQKGNAEAEFNLGLCYLFGRGVEENREEAFRYTVSAANKNYAH